MGFTKIDTCIVCEVIRPELNNKNILFGFFGITPYVTVQLQNLKLPASLCFVFCGGPSIGTFTVRLRIIDPNGIEVTNSQNSPPVQGQLHSPRGGSNVYLGFNGILGTAGRYRVSLLVDDKEVYDTSVGIEQMTQPLIQ